MLGEDARRRRALTDRAAYLFESCGYAYAETPVFEDTELFARGVGESTDIVQKEMFTFEDLGGRSMTLRPEGTAGICRAYIEHGMHKLPQPVKVWYQGPFFRYEAPQAGRFRQFSQIGAEALGSDDPTLDAEMILGLAELLTDCELPSLRLRLASLGTPESRRAYSEELTTHLRDRAGELSGDVRARFETNPLRAFDSDHPGTRAVMAEAPKLLDRLAPEDAEHFAEVRALLDDAEQPYEIDPTLVRGLDYYTRTVFEFVDDALGAQSGVGGGGRYDGLVEQLGGPATPGVGWAAGVDRILLAGGKWHWGLRGDHPSMRVYVAREEGSSPLQAFEVVRTLRRAGLHAEMEQAGRSLKGQLRHAGRIDAETAVVVGPDGLRVRDLRGGGGEHSAADVREAVAMVAGLR